MAKIYISSTWQDLRPERDRVTACLLTQGHHPLHSYRPNSETVRDSCLTDVDTSDVLVLILGHRYGGRPEIGNPENLSITHLEFRRAVDNGIPIVALIKVPNPAPEDPFYCDMESPRWPLFKAFKQEVTKALRTGLFHNETDLVDQLVAGVDGELKKIEAQTGNAKHKALEEELAQTKKERAQDREALADFMRANRELRLQLEAAKAAEQANATPAERAAAVSLVAGDTRPAESLLNTEERTQADRPGTEGNKEAAKLAREQGARAMGRDVRAALAAYARAAEYEPDDFWTEIFIGDLQKLLGNLIAASGRYTQARQIAEKQAARDPENTEWQRDLSVSHNKIGDILADQGNGPSALAAYRAGLQIAEALTARDPENTEWQRDLSVSHNRIGDILAAQGDGPSALAAYRAGLQIAEALAARDPENTQWQRDLSVSHNRIGDILAAQGNGPSALAAYRAGLQIRETLAARDPENTEWQRDLSVSHDRIGDILAAQGNGPSALAAYRAGLQIAEALAARDPENTEWQRDLSVSHNRIGDILAAQGDGPSALAAYRAGLQIAEALAARDPENTEWQRDLSISHDKIGNILAAQGDGPFALAAYRAGLRIAEALAACDPENTEWQRDLSVTHDRIGDILAAQGDGPSALAAYHAGLQIREALATRDPENAGWQTDLAISCSRLGTLQHAQTSQERRAWLIRGRDILLALKQRNRLHRQQGSISWFEARLREFDESNHVPPDEINPIPPTT